MRGEVQDRLGIIKEKCEAQEKGRVSPGLEAPIVWREWRENEGTTSLEIPEKWWREGGRAESARPKNSNPCNCKLNAKVDDEVDDQAWTK